jgi:hypothetical protein
MKHPTYQELVFKLAWEFTTVLPGSFERDRKAVAGRKYPIIAPLPNNARNTLPIENRLARGPYLYSIYTQDGEIKYIGKASDETVLMRWIRPDKSRTKYYWTHGTTSAKAVSTVEKIAEEISNSNGPVRLYFANYFELFTLVQQHCQVCSVDTSGIDAMQHDEFIKELEHYMIYTLQPLWNIQNKKKPPTSSIMQCGDYWNAYF